MPVSTPWLVRRRAICRSFPLVKCRERPSLNRRDYRAASGALIVGPEQT